MTYKPVVYVWRTGWHILGRMLSRNLAQADNALYYKMWFSWRMPVFWITALLFCLPLGMLSKFLADRNHVFAAMYAHLINVVAVLPIGAYFSLKWWVEKKNRPGHDGPGCPPQDAAP